MLRSCIRVRVDRGCLYAILRRCSAYATTVSQHLQQAWGKGKTDRAISPRLAISIDVNGWFGVDA
jgi:hypothetical protein